MLICFSKRSIVRYYGNYTYILGKNNAFDQVYENAQIFTKFITKTPLQKTKILASICAEFPGIDQNEIKNDFDDFITPLINCGIILTGENESEIENADKKFTYNCDNPKTQIDDIQNAPTKDRGSKQLLDDYFIQHPTLFALQIDVTQACTERCRHCYIPEHNPCFLATDKICEVIKEFRDMGGVGITLSGGECMLHPDFAKIVRYANSQDCSVCVLSNLTCCDDTIIALLRDTDATVQASLYGMSPVTHDKITNRPGSWIETITAIVKLRAADVPVSIACPCMQINYKEYLSVVQFAKSLKISANTDYILKGKTNRDCSNLCNRLTLSQTQSLLREIYRDFPFAENTPNESRSVEDWNKSKICGACINKMCLGADGNYYPCSAFSGMPLGNCFSQRLNDVWLNSPSVKKIRNITKGDFPKCASCADRDFCAICICRNFNETGDMFKIPEYCCDVARVCHNVIRERQEKI